MKISCYSLAVFLASSVWVLLITDLQCHIRRDWCYQPCTYLPIWYHSTKIHSSTNVKIIFIRWRSGGTCVEDTFKGIRMLEHLVPPSSVDLFLSLVPTQYFGSFWPLTLTCYYFNTQVYTLLNLLYVLVEYLIFLIWKIQCIHLCISNICNFLKLFSMMFSSWSQTNLINVRVILIHFGK